MKSIVFRIRKKFIAIYKLFGEKSYMKHMVALYKKTSVVFNGNPKFIAYNVNLDCLSEGKIYIGEGTVITNDVIILTHDYSVECGLVAIGKQDETYESLFYKDVVIGKNVFIGQRSLVLPGVHIGNNCIIGAGSIVTRDVPDDTIVAGNPAKEISKTSAWAERKYSEHNYKNGSKRR